MREKFLRWAPSATSIFFMAIACTLLWVRLIGWGLLCFIISDLAQRSMRKRLDRQASDSRMSFEVADLANDRFAGLLFFRLLVYFGYAVSWSGEYGRDFAENWRIALICGMITVSFCSLFLGWCIILYTRNPIRESRAEP